MVTVQFRWFVMIVAKRLILKQLNLLRVFGPFSNHARVLNILYLLTCKNVFI